jgi:phosphoribosylformylglycinamidine synthase subunit PurS
MAPITKTALRFVRAYRIINRLMKAYVYVSLKKSVLDPQGKTIHGALQKIGYKSLQDVRQGKYFELTLNGSVTKDEAQAEVERIAREVLTNPVIEEFRFSLEE